MTFYSDAPDEQFGIVTGQNILAQRTGAQTTATVTFVQTTETLLVVFTIGGSSAQILSVVGATSGASYPFAPLGNNSSGYSSFLWAIAVSPVVDNSVIITLKAATGGTWYVVSDQGVRIIADVTLASIQQSAANLVQTLGLPVLGWAHGTSEFFLLATDTGGQQFVISGVPGETSLDHPLNEVKMSSGAVISVAGLTVVVAAPGPSNRLRIYKASIGTRAAAGHVANLNDGINQYCASYGVGLGPQFYDGPGQGFPLPANTALSVAVSNIGDVVDYNITYTIEAN